MTYGFVFLSCLAAYAVAQTADWALTDRDCTSTTNPAGTSNDGVCGFLFDATNTGSAVCQSCGNANDKSKNVDAFLQRKTLTGCSSECLSRLVNMMCVRECEAVSGGLTPYTSFCATELDTLYAACNTAGCGVLSADGETSVFPSRDTWLSNMGAVKQSPSNNAVGVISASSAGNCQTFQKSKSRPTESQAITIDSVSYDVKRGSAHDGTSITGGTSFTQEQAWAADIFDGTQTLSTVVAKFHLAATQTQVPLKAKIDFYFPSSEASLIAKTVEIPSSKITMDGQRYLISNADSPLWLSDNSPRGVYRAVLTVSNTHSEVTSESISITEKTCTSDADCTDAAGSSKFGKCYTKPAGKRCVAADTYAINTVNPAAPAYKAALKLCAPQSPANGGVGSQKVPLSNDAFTTLSCCTANAKTSTGLDVCSVTAGSKNSLTNLQSLNIEQTGTPVFQFEKLEVTVTNQLVDVTQAAQLNTLVSTPLATSYYGNRPWPLLLLNQSSITMGNTNAKLVFVQGGAECDAQSSINMAQAAEIINRRGSANNDGTPAYTAGPVPDHRCPIQATNGVFKIMGGNDNNNQVKVGITGTAGKLTISANAKGDGANANAARIVGDGNHGVLYIDSENSGDALTIRGSHQFDGYSTTTSSVVTNLAQVTGLEGIEIKRGIMRVDSLFTGTYDAATGANFQSTPIVAVPVTVGIAQDAFLPTYLTSTKAAVQSTPASDSPNYVCCGAACGSTVTLTNGGKLFFGLKEAGQTAPSGSTYECSFPMEWQHTGAAGAATLKSYTKMNHPAVIGHIETRLGTGDVYGARAGNGATQRADDTRGLGGYNTGAGNLQNGGYILTAAQSTADNLNGFPNYPIPVSMPGAAAAPTVLTVDAASRLVFADVSATSVPVYAAGGVSIAGKIEVTLSTSDVPSTEFEVFLILFRGDCSSFTADHILSNAGSFPTRTANLACKQFSTTTVDNMGPWNYTTIVNVGPFTPDVLKRLGAPGKGIANVGSAANNADVNADNHGFAAIILEVSAPTVSDATTGPVINQNTGPFVSAKTYVMRFTNAAFSTAAAFKAAVESKYNLPAGTKINVVSIQQVNTRATQYEAVYRVSSPNSVAAADQVGRDISAEAVRSGSTLNSDLGVTGVSESTPVDPRDADDDSQEGLFGLFGLLLIPVIIGFVVCILIRQKTRKADNQYMQDTSTFSNVAAQPQSMAQPAPYYNNAQPQATYPAVDASYAAYPPQAGSYVAAPQGYAPQPPTYSSGMA